MQFWIPFFNLIQITVIVKFQISIIEQGGGEDLDFRGNLKGFNVCLWLDF